MGAGKQGGGGALVWGQDGDLGLGQRRTAFGAGSSLRDHPGHM